MKNIQTGNICNTTFWKPIHIIVSYIIYHFYLFLQLLLKYCVCLDVLNFWTFCVTFYEIDFKSMTSYWFFFLLLVYLILDVGPRFIFWRHHSRTGQIQRFIEIFCFFQKWTLTHFWNWSIKDTYKKNNQVVWPIIFHNL